MAERGKKGKGGKRKLGRDLKKCARYRLMRTREKRKVVKIAKSSGHTEALAYATRNGLSDWAKHRLKSLQPRINRKLQENTNV